MSSTTEDNTSNLPSEIPIRQKLEEIVLHHDKRMAESDKERHYPEGTQVYFTVNQLEALINSEIHQVRVEVLLYELKNIQHLSNVNNWMGCDEYLRDRIKDLEWQ